MNIFKKILIGVSLATLIVYSVFAAFVADITLTWQNNPAEEFVTKYVIYQAKSPSTNFVPIVTVVGTNVGKVRVLSPGTYYFKVSAFNGVGESELSDTMQVPSIIASKPQNAAILSVTATNN